MKNVILYLNQFYGGIGGEDKANTPPSILEGVVGPGVALNKALSGGQITHTIICGDDYMNEHGEEAVHCFRGGQRLFIKECADDAADAAHIHNAGKTQIHVAGLLGDDFTGGAVEQGDSLCNSSGEERNNETGR